MSTIKNKLIKIAYENPELRGDLLPVIMKQANVNASNKINSIEIGYSPDWETEYNLVIDLEGNFNGEPLHLKEVEKYMVGAHKFHDIEDLAENVRDGVVDHLKSKKYTEEQEDMLYHLILEALEHHNGTKMMHHINKCVEGQDRAYMQDREDYG
jgi:hypothetical protein